MSYFDSISQFKQAGDAIQQQIADAQTAHNDKKSATLEDKFKHIDDLMNEVGGGLGGLSGGIHIGRKVYKKIKTARAKAQEAIENAKKKAQGDSSEGPKEPDSDATTNETDPQTHANKPNGEEDTANGDQVEAEAKAQAPEEGPETADASDPRLADIEPLDPDKPFGEEVPKASPAEATRDQIPEGAETGTGDVSNLGARQGQLTDEDIQNLTQDTPRAGPKPDAEPNSAPAEAGRGGDTFGEDIYGKQQFVGEGENMRVGTIADQPAIKKTGGTLVDEGTEEASRLLTTGASQDAGGLVDKVSGIAGQVSDKINAVKDVASGAKQMVKEGAEKVVGSDALEAIGGAMDFLGPAGEIIGAGIALGSFFHDLFDKKKLEKKQAEAQAQVGNIAQVGGIDTSSLSLGAVKSNVVGTIV